MARLRNRILKADFWSDGELLRWPREKRLTYAGLFALAEDSGCLEDDSFTWKILLWGSPLDADITVEKLEAWRDELIEAGKLLPYVSDGQNCLFIKSFHEHEHPRNPQTPNVPLPPWITWVPTPTPAAPRRGHYEIEEIAACKPSRNGKKPKAELEAPVEMPARDEEFEKFWSTYPRRRDKMAAQRAWKRVPKREREFAMTVAMVMKQLVDQGEQELEFVPYPQKYLNRKLWMDWAEGIPAGWVSRETKRANENQASIDAALAEAGLV